MKFTSADANCCTRATLEHNHRTSGVATSIGVPCSRQHNSPQPALNHGYLLSGRRDVAERPRRLPSIHQEYAGRAWSKRHHPCLSPGSGNKAAHVKEIPMHHPDALPPSSATRRNVPNQTESLLRKKKKKTITLRDPQKLRDCRRSVSRRRDAVKPNMLRLRRAAPANQQTATRLCCTPTNRHPSLPFSPVPRPT